MKFKIVAIDLDGTLLNDNKQIDLQTIKYLEFLSKNNIKIVIATGRSFYDAKRLTVCFSFEYTIIANNGALTVKSQNDEIISLKTINNNDFKKVIKLAKMYQLHPIVYVNKLEQKFDIIIEHPNDFLSYNGYMLKKQKRYKIIDFQNYNDSDILSICFTGKYETLNIFRERINIQYPEMFNSFISLNLHVEALLEFLNIDSCKWKALADFAHISNINVQNILSFGDDNNDIEMLENSGLSIAMANSTLNLKQHADIISLFNNNNNGVFIELKKIFGE